MHSSFKTFIFDLDRTLYPYASDILPQVDEKIAVYCQKICDVPLKTAHTIRKKYYTLYGTTLTGLIKEYNVNPDDFLDDVHHINYDSLKPCIRLTDALSQLSGRKIIYTNGTKQHALNVLNKRGIGHIFEAIHDIRAANLQAKPCKNAFSDFIKEYNIIPSETIFFDDSHANTKTAKALGLYSVHVLEGKTPSPHDYYKDHSHETIYSLTHYLNKLKKNTIPSFSLQPKAIAHA